jgi:molybdate transport system substrate-binding protein
VTRKAGLLVLLAAVIGGGCSQPSGVVAPGASAQADVLVFAASSLQTALDELEPAIAGATGVRVRNSYAATPALARQIENGAPADLFIAADLAWMDHLAERTLIRADSRTNLLGNQLVLIAPVGRAVPLRIAGGFALAHALGSGRLAMAEPESVPAGRYARAALRALGVWDDVSSRVAATENVRSALRLVSRGEVPLGIVYRTDALADPGVVVVDVFPAATHPAILYPAALTGSASANAQRVLEFLSGPEASDVFARHGFVTSP